MRHARPDDLLPIAPLLTDLRRIPGLVERTPGSFYRKGAGMLHFHHDPAGMFADVKLDGAWQRLPASTEAEWSAVLAATAGWAWVGAETEPGRDRRS